LSQALILLLALLLDAALGEPKWLWQRLPHPAVLMGRLVGFLELHLNRGRARRAKGLLAAVLLVIAGLAIGALLGRLGPLVELLVAAILLAQRSLVDHVEEVARGLRLSLAQGRRAVALIVSRDTGEMDQSAVARSAIESAAENLSDGVIAPAFWFLLLGLPGLVTYKLINTADSMVGYRNERYAQFGTAAARLDDLLNLLPARLTALLIALTHGALDQWRAIAADARQHKSPNAGWPEAATARALGVALAGPRAYGGVMQPLAWVNGSAKRELGPRDIDAVVAALWRAWALAGALLIGLWLVGLG
jgi:adenosylcobinamide-phosphate synthase